MPCLPLIASKTKTMEKIDLKKDLKQLYKASAKKPAMVEAPALSYLMIDGVGNPNTAPAYMQAIEALYPVAYTLKFTAKKGELARDYTVMPLEGLWWAEDHTAFAEGRMDEWLWTMMILQPDFITPEMVAEAMQTVAKKKAPPALPLMRFETRPAHTAAQILHIGPYDQEGPTVEGLHAFISEQGKQLAGKHHEIYLSDPRRSAPEKLKTIVRQECR